MDLISYIRVSDLGERDPEAERTQTIRQQREANAAIVKLTPGARIVDEVVALNASGGKKWPEPKLAECIKRVDDGEADGVVVYALDRFGRHLDALTVIERWAQEDKTFLSASDKFDATTASGRMALRMMMTVARFYWEMVRDRFALSQANAIERGAYIGRTPLGYERNEDSILVIDPEMAPVVQEAFRLAAVDDMHATMVYLEEQVPDRRWRTDETRRLLSQRAYLGESRFGELVNENAHPALIDAATFEAAQTEPKARRSNGDYVLSHVATCAACGGPLVGALQTVRGKTYRRMRCSQTCKGGVGSISADALEGHVREWIKERLGGWMLDLEIDHGSVRDAEQALEQAEAERARYAADLEVRDILGDKAWREGAKARSVAVDHAREHLRSIANEHALYGVMPAVERLDDDAELLRAIRVGIASIVVSPGRGAVSERVRIDLANGHA